MKRRVALVGCGRWGGHILRDLVSLGCDVIVVDPAEEQRQGALRSGASAALLALKCLGLVMLGTSKRLIQQSEVQVSYRRLAALAVAEWL